MNVRILPVDEWKRLEGVSGRVAATLLPEDVDVVVVEDQGKIIATMTVMRVVHFESLWIDPAYRGRPGVVGRLWTRAVESAKKFGARWVWGASDTDKMSNIILRIGGQPIKVDSAIIPIGD